MPLSWTGITAFNRHWIAGAYSPTLARFVAVTTDSPARIMTSPDGATWTDQGTKWIHNLNGDQFSASAGSLNCLRWDPVSVQFLAISVCGKDTDSHIHLMLYTSADGITWSRSEIADLGLNTQGKNICGIAYGGTYAVPVWTTGAGTVVYTSTDLMSWASVAVPAGLKPSSVIYANGQYVCVGNSSSIPIITATDPTAVSPAAGGWTGQMGFTVGFINIPWLTLAYGAGVYLAVGTDTNHVQQYLMTSPDGATWTRQTPPTESVPHGWEGVLFDSLYGFVAVAYGGVASEASMVSTDAGVTWTLLATPDEQPPNDAAGFWTAVIAGPGHQLVGINDLQGGQLFSVMTQVRAWYYNPSTNHYQYSASAPGAPWIAQTPTFTVNCAAITPTNGPLAGGTFLSVPGTGFGDGAIVTVGGLPLTGQVVVDQTLITGYTQAHAIGAVDVVVTNDDGTVITCAGAFTYANQFLDLSTEANPGGLWVSGVGFPEGGPGGPGQTCLDTVSNGPDSGGGTGCVDGMDT